MSDNMRVCEHCLYAIEAHEGNQARLHVFVDEEDETESECDFCHEKGFCELYELV